MSEEKNDKKGWWWDGIWWEMKRQKKLKISNTAREWEREKRDGMQRRFRAQGLKRLTLAPKERRVLMWSKSCPVIWLGRIRSERRPSAVQELFQRGLLLETHCGYSQTVMKQVLNHWKPVTPSLILSSLPGVSHWYSGSRDCCVCRVVWLCPVESLFLTESSEAEHLMIWRRCPFVWRSFFRGMDNFLKKRMIYLTSGK